jgi:histidyl-tRNA synthetase
VSQKIAGVKGMNDLLGPDIAVWHALEAAARRTCERFGYEEARTPVLEDTALFVRSVGEGTDIVGKEMYTFEDKAGRSLSLRPEGTAPLVRAYIEHAVAQQEPLTRWWYLGPMFRYERMKTGRYRQFWQVGAEAYGAAGPAQEAELIDLAAALPLGGAGRIRLGSIPSAMPTRGPATSRRCRPSSAPGAAGLCPSARSAPRRTPFASSTARTPDVRPF